MSQPEMVVAEHGAEELPSAAREAGAVKEEGYENILWQSLDEVKNACEEVKFVRKRIVQSLDEATASFVHILTSLEYNSQKVNENEL